MATSKIVSVTIKSFIGNSQIIERKTRHNIHFNFRFQFIWGYQLKNAVKALDNNKNKMDQGETLLKALLMVNLLGELNIPMDILSSETVDIIHYSLLLSIDANSSQCPQLDSLDKCLESSLKKYVYTCIQHFSAVVHVF